MLNILMHITYFYISIIIIKGKPIRILACSIWYRCLLACLSVGLHSVHSQTGGDVDIVCDICKKKTLYKNASIRMFLLQEVKLQGLKERLFLDLYPFP